MRWAYECSWLQTNQDVNQIPPFSRCPTAPPQQVKQNFDRFISCKTTIDDIYLKLQHVESAGTGISTQVLFNAVSEVQGPSKRAFGPLMERHSKAERIKSVQVCVWGEGVGWVGGCGTVPINCTPHQSTSGDLNQPTNPPQSPQGPPPPLPLALQHAVARARPGGGPRLRAGVRRVQEGKRPHPPQRQQHHQGVGAAARRDRKGEARV